MAQPYAELPNTIFGLTSSQQRVLRIKELLSYYKVPFSKSATKVQLLRHLATLEDQFSDREQRYLSAWLRGGGLLSDLKATLRKAQALTKNITVVMESSLLARELIVPLSGEQECSVCLTTFTGDAFPRKRISTSCKHGSFTCLACLKQSLEIQVQENPWDHITCPECPAMIAYQGVKEFASPQAFERYEQKAALASFQAMPNFAMCSGPNCGSGQIHSSGARQPIMKCTACNFRTCFTHKIPWHAGLTCAEYNTFHKSREEQEIASTSYLMRNSKICPNPTCGLHVQKIDGCDHIYCTHCKFEFCWACLAPYDPIRRLGNAAHAKSCKHHTGHLPHQQNPVPIWQR